MKNDEGKSYEGILFLYATKEKNKENNKWINFLLFYVNFE
jgi:hypothetical protein